MARNINKKVWFVDFPTYQYKEDVIELAIQHRLKIVDARYKSEFRAEDIATEVPKLTKKTAKQLEADL